ncbi:MAG: lipopolysaccharide assembly protein LapB [Burkholderiaceae bacterium]|jgi:lipopolysaccharide biosynthesis regulator YciM|nr:lipopolysaccharide assembly protein LapB [Burkholderiaceae bacterium]
MEFDLTWILLGLPIAFALGWVASRLDLRQLRMENRQAPRAYFKGLNYLLNEQQDQAIDAFIEAVQKDPDTSELHFALGNLFRRRGDYERAVRVHEHLLSRGDISTADRDRAQHALALDFLKAGLIDHAESALGKLEGTAHAQDAWLALLALFERTREWDKATAIARKLQAARQADFTGRLAHYRCEQALTAWHRHQDFATAQALLEQAIADAPGQPRARIELARLLDARGQSAQAFAVLARLPDLAPQALPLVAAELARLGKRSGQLEKATAILAQHFAQAPSVDVTEALVQARCAAGMPMPEARNSYLLHMAQESSLIAATRWLASEPAIEAQAHATVQHSLERAVRAVARYRCAACGFEAQTYFWQCPGCQSWDSFPPRRIEELWHGPV